MNTVVVYGRIMTRQSSITSWRQTRETALRRKTLACAMHTVVEYSRIIAKRSSITSWRQIRETALRSIIWVVVMKQESA